MGGVIKTLVFLGLPTILIGAPVLLAVSAIAPAPLITANGSLGMDQVKHAQEFLARYDPRQMKPEHVTEVTASEGEINTAIAAALSGVREVKGKVQITRSGLAFAASVELPLPENRLGRYVNLRALVEPSPSGISITRLAIGEIEVPPAIVRPLLVLAPDALLGPGKGEPAFESVREVSVAGNRITIAFRPPPTLAADVKAAARRHMAAADPEKVRVYYAMLIEIATANPSLREVSLTTFVGPLFRRAQESARGADPVEESRAAIIALAMYFGDARFDRFVGEVLTGALQDHRPRIQNVRLEGRHDWVQHFVVSAGLVVASGSGIANVIGEAKEIQDADGPSGFSFTDIAADRAGVRFAERATSSPANAAAFQRALAGSMVESDFFPKVGNLPEGLSDIQFRRAFGGTDTPAYAAVVREIDRRIGLIPLFK